MNRGYPPLPVELPYWSQKMLLTFCGAATRQDYKKGDTILHPLMTNQFLFLVESGVIDYRYFSKDGEAMTISQVRPGELFGLKAIMDGGDDEGGRRYFFVVADTDARLWKISREKFLALMEHDFEFSKGIVQYFVHYIDLIQKKLMRSAILDNYQHMVLLLLDYAENVKNNTAVVQMTQQNLADLLTLSRQSVSGYLSAMAKQGLIAVKRGRIYILDWNALNMELL